METSPNSTQKGKSSFIVTILAIFTLLGTAQITLGQVFTNGGAGLATTYTSLAVAITALNALPAVTAPITITLTGNEIAPTGGYAIKAQGSTINTINISGLGSIITASNTNTTGSLTDAVFKLIGADYVTIENFIIQENISNTNATVATNNMTEWGIALLYATTTNGAQNNTIQNNTISLNRSYRNTFGIYSNVRHTATNATTAADIISSFGANSNNKVFSNIISNVNAGITFIGSGIDANMDTGNNIGGISAATSNNITDWGGATAASIFISNSATSYCIFLNHQTNSNVANNSIVSALVSGTAVQFTGILQTFSGSTPATSMTNVISYNQITMRSAFTSGNLTHILTDSDGVNITLNMTNNEMINSSLSGVATTSSITGINNDGNVGTLRINNNTIRGWTATSIGGAFLGLSNAGFITNSLQMNNNIVGTAAVPAIIYSAATVSSITVISNSFGEVLSTATMSGNDIRGIIHNVTSSGAQTYINASAFVLTNTVTNNTFTNITANTTGNVTFINHNSTISPSGTQTISNNRIITAFSKIASGGTVAFTYSNGASPTGSTSTITNNNFSNITVTGATILYGIQNTDGTSTTAPNRTVTNNIFNNWSGGTGNYTAMSFLNNGTNTNINLNTISNFNTSGNIAGIVVGGGFGGGNPLTVARNTINSFTSTAAGVIGILCASPSPISNITENTITGFFSTGGAGGTEGMSISGGAVVNITKNKIGNIQCNTVTGTVDGLTIYGGTTVNANNNLIGDLRTPIASSITLSIRGINIISTTTSSTLNISFNTVYLAATSSGATFNTTAIYHVTNATATTASLVMRSNNFVNNSTSNGAGSAVAYRRSNTVLTNFSTTSNRNNFFASRILFDGTSFRTTLANYKTHVNPADANSISEDPIFLSTNVNSPSFLHINTATATTLESAGMATGSISTDYDADIRQGNAGYVGTGTAPDIGADEFNVASTCPTITFGNITTVSPNAIIGAAYTLNGSATATAGTLNYSISPALPSGLTFNTTTGLISGTHNIAVANATYTITAFTSGTCFATQTYSFAVVCPTVTFNNTTATNGTIGTAFSLNGSASSAVSYTVTPTLPSGLSINTTNGTISGTPTTATVSTTYTVTAIQSVVACNVAQTYTFAINAIPCPTITFGNITTISPNATIGTAYTLNGGATATSGTLTYSITPTLPASLSLNTATGVISGTPNTTTISATYIVRAQTSITCFATQSYTFAVVCPSIIFTNTTATNGTVGTTFSLNASASSAVSYTVTPTLPNGLSINTTNGTISGTPTTATASTTYTVTAIQSVVACNAAQTYTFAINATPCPTITFGNITTISPNAIIGTAYTLNGGATATSGTLTYSITPALPASLSLNTATGVISGTPNATAISATYIVRAQTSVTCFATQSYTFAVVCPSIIFTNITATNGTVGTAFSLNASASNAVSYTVTPTLPNGLSINTTNGTISGTPTTATASTTYTVTAIQSVVACNVAQTYTFAINATPCPTIIFTNTSATGATVGVAYNLNVSATATFGTLSYSIFPTLPAGLLFSITTGLISGNPSVATVSTTYTVTASTSITCSTIQTYTFAVINVVGCPIITFGSDIATNGTVGNAYNLNVSATTTFGTLNYSISPALPTGLSLNTSTGSISGTPTNVTNLNTYVVTATASVGCSNTKTYIFEIIANAVTAIDSSLANNIKIFPNPSTGNFNVDFGTINMAKSSVSIYDAQGKTVFSSENNSNVMNISLDKFVNGIYLLEVKTLNGRITKRLAKTN